MFLHGTKFFENRALDGIKFLLSYRDGAPSPRLRIATRCPSEKKFLSASFLPQKSVYHLFLARKAMPSIKNARIEAQK